MTGLACPSVQSLHRELQNGDSFCDSMKVTDECSYYHILLASLETKRSVKLFIIARPSPFSIKFILGHFKYLLISICGMIDINNYIYRVSHEWTWTWTTAPRASYTLIMLRKKRNQYMKDHDKKKPTIEFDEVLTTNVSTATMAVLCFPSSLSEKCSKQCRNY